MADNQEKTVTVLEKDLVALVETTEQLKKDLHTALEAAYKGFQPLNELASSLNGSGIGGGIAKLGKLMQGDGINGLIKQIEPNVNIVVSVMARHRPDLLPAETLAKFTAAKTEEG